MNTFLLRADDALRRRPWTVQAGHNWSSLGFLTADVVVFGMLYGCVMGSFGGVLGERFWQVCYSALKVPLLLFATFLLSLPSFFVLSSLFGLRKDFAQAVRGMLASQAGLSIVLASLAPFTAVWYASSSSYAAATLFNGLMFAVASFSGQWLLRGYFQPLIARNPRHRQLLWAWLVIYSFVGIQMGWLLRPYIGEVNSPVQFFRADTWGNAYVVVIQLIYDVLLR